MKKRLLGFAAAAMLATAPVVVQANTVGSSPMLMPQLNHVWVIMLENQSRSEIIGNVNAPFLTAEAASANSSSNYFGVGHPSLTNYLELNGGSNFGIDNDVWPAWINGGCVDNAPSSGCGGAVPPIPASGTDEAIPATGGTTSDVGLPYCDQQLDFTGSPIPNNCAARDYPAATFTGQTIADQLVAVGKTWKSYQQSLPSIGSRVDGVNYSDGTFSNLEPATFWTSNSPTPSLPKLYAVKHNPFVYFPAVQQGTNPALSEAQVVDFDGTNGLWADLAGNTSPTYSFIAPDQCHDVHMVGGSENVCTEDALAIQAGDAMVKKLVTAIKSTKMWSAGHNAIVILFDENDYANAQNVVPFIVDKNYGPWGVQSSVVYDHFSLLRTLEAGFGLPCLNHACDATSKVMVDLFGISSSQPTE